MSAPRSFSEFVGNARAVRILRASIERGRLPHALIFAGPEGVGKKTLALILARLLNCLSPANGEPCGRCRSCRKIDAGVHPDVIVVQPDGAFIKIEQVRAIRAEAAYQPFEGRFRVVVLDGADRMRPEGANCLLKTLEEPPSRTVLILVTAQPYLLLPTISSRSQLLQFGPIPEDRIAEHLVRAAGLRPEEARLAAALADGSLGAALAFDIGAYREARAQALRFVSLLLGRGSFAEVSRLAAGLPKEREQFLSWLSLVESLLQDAYYAKVAPWRLSQPDAIEEARALAGRAPHSAVASAIRAIQSLRRSTFYNVNRQIALESLFLARRGELS